jgi:hypothetical protein
MLQEAGFGVDIFSFQETCTQHIYIFNFGTVRKKILILYSGSHGILYSYVVVLLALQHCVAQETGMTVN